MVNIDFEFMTQVTELVRECCLHPRQKKVANKNEVGIHFCGAHPPEVSLVEDLIFNCEFNPIRF